jgi:hypothetical protein
VLSLPPTKQLILAPQHSRLSIRWLVDRRELADEPTCEEVMNLRDSLYRIDRGRAVPLGRRRRLRLCDGYGDKTVIQPGGGIALFPVLSVSSSLDRVDLQLSI